MNCTKCGQESSEQAQFCQGCGAALQMPRQQPNILRVVMDKRILAVIGLIAGVLALVGIFTPWAKVSALGTSVSASAWDSVINARIMGVEIERYDWTCIALAGAILTLVGALSALVSPKTRMLWVILAIGGLLAIIGSAWGFSDISHIPSGGILSGGIFGGGILGVSVGYGPGVYLTLVGGILGLAGVLGLWRG